MAHTLKRTVARTLVALAIIGGVASPHALPPSRPPICRAVDKPTPGCPGPKDTAPPLPARRQGVVR